MLVILKLLRSLEQINTRGTSAECLIPNCLLSLRAETAVKCSSTGPSLIIFPFKCQDKEYQTAVLFRMRSRLWADKISFFILCLLLHSLCHGAQISLSSSFFFFFFFFFQERERDTLLLSTLRRHQSQSRTDCMTSNKFNRFGSSPQSANYPNAISALNGL